MKNFLKSAYNIIPFKRELFTVVKLIWAPRESTYRHLHFKGAFKVRADREKSFKIKHYGFQVENEIFWAGLKSGWESESFSLWMQLCRKSKVIFDIGANTGVYALLAKAINPVAKVYAFDPVKRVYDRLVENNKLNNFDIHCYEEAISNNDGEAVIYDTMSDHVYSVTVNRNLCGENTEVRETKVKTVKLDTFIRENNIPKIDLLKIDVETHEPEVLEGYSDFIKQHEPTMLLEVLEDQAGERLEALLKGMNYKFFNVIEKGGVKLTDQLKAMPNKNYLICTEEIARDLKLIKD